MPWLQLSREGGTAIRADSCACDDAVYSFSEKMKAIYESFPHRGAWHDCRRRPMTLTRNVKRTLAARALREAGFRRAYADDVTGLGREAARAPSASRRRFRPVHPGVILRRDFLDGLGLSQRTLARRIGVSPSRISAIVCGRRAITPDTARRLGRFWGIESEFWLRLQQHFDLDVARDAAGG